MTLMSFSKNHHYLPEFYTKGFTNSENLFAVFNSKSKRMNPGMKSPASHFYTKHLNTITFRGYSSDLIEKHYGLAENRASKLLTKMRSFMNPVLTTMDKIWLQEFVNDIFWRIPANDLLFRKEVQTSPVVEEWENIILRSTGLSRADPEFVQTRNSDHFYTSLKPRYASAVFQANSYNNLSEWRILPISSGKLVCSDYPFIFRKDGVKSVYEDDFMFPLAKNLLLIKCSRNFNPARLPKDFIDRVNYAFFIQALSFSCGHDKKYLENVSIQAGRFELDKLTSDLFGDIFGCAVE